MERSKFMILIIKKKWKKRKMFNKSLGCQIGLSLVKSVVYMTTLLLI